jgi:hypothetical protein
VSRWFSGLGATQTDQEALTMIKAIAANVVLLSLAGIAAAQTPLPLTNPSFENENPFNPGEPEGWHNLSNPLGARHRANNDGLTPPVTARSGNRCVELLNLNPGPGQGNGGFIGFTTDTLNFNLPNVPWYDPVFDWDGGDVLVTGWYMIPEDRALTEPERAGIKLDVKIPGPQNAASLDPINPDQTTLPFITGHTGGQWRQYTLRWSITDIQREVRANSKAGFFPLPPFPNRVKITLARFAPDGTPTTGSIFWDDITYEQVSACPGDWNGDGVIDFNDFLAYLNDYNVQDPRADINGDGVIDFNDLLAFLNLFNTPCP